MFGLGVGVGPTHDEAPIRPLCTRGPDLLTVQDPLVTLELGAGLHTGEIRAGVGLGIALTPDLIARQNFRQESLLLILGSKMDQRRTEQSFTDMSHTTGPPGPSVFFVKNHLLSQRATATAHTLWPTHSDPTGLAEQPFPGVAFLEERVFVAGPTTTPHDLELTLQVSFEPAGHLSAKSLIFFGESSVQSGDLRRGSMSGREATPPRSRTLPGLASIRGRWTLRYDPTRMQDPSAGDQTWACQAAPELALRTDFLNFFFSSTGEASQFR